MIVLDVNGCGEASAPNKHHLSTRSWSCLGGTLPTLTNQPPLSEILAMA